MTAFAEIDGKLWDGTLSGATGAEAYIPSLIDPNGVAIWTIPGAVFDAEKRLSFSVRRPTKGSQVIRVQAKLVHPVMDSVDTTLKLGDILINLECVFPKRSTEAQRKKAVGHISEFIYNSPEFAAAVATYESVY
jgi:hypothetical protein